MARKTVLLVDAHSVVRQGCRNALAQLEDIKVVGEAACGREALEKVKTLKPTIMVTDLSLPSLNGFEIIRRIKISPSQTRVVVFSAQMDETYVYRAFRAGAFAYVVKQGSTYELLEATKAVAAGNMYISPLISRSVVKGFLEFSDRLGVAGEIPITDREREVLQLVTEGLSSREIARCLETSPRTIDGHRQRLMNKLGVHSAPELVKYAIRKNLITLDG